MEEDKEDVLLSDEQKKLLPDIHKKLLSDEDKKNLLTDEEKKRLLTDEEKIRLLTDEEKERFMAEDEPRTPEEAEPPSGLGSTYESLMQNVSTEEEERVRAQFGSPIDLGEDRASMNLPPVSDFQSEHVNEGSHDDPAALAGNLTGPADLDEFDTLLASALQGFLSDESGKVQSIDQAQSQSLSENVLEGDEDIRAEYEKYRTRLADEFFIEDYEDFLANLQVFRDDPDARAGGATTLIEYLEWELRDVASNVEDKGEGGTSRNLFSQDNVDASGMDLDTQSIPQQQQQDGPPYTSQLPLPSPVQRLDAPASTDLDNSMDAHADDTWMEAFAPPERPRGEPNYGMPQSQPFETFKPAQQSPWTPPPIIPADPQQAPYNPFGTTPLQPPLVATPAFGNSPLAPGMRPNASHGAEIKSFEFGVTGPSSPQQHVAEQNPSRTTTTSGNSPPTFEMQQGPFNFSFNTAQGFSSQGSAARNQAHRRPRGGFASSGSNPRGPSRKPTTLRQTRNVDDASPETSPKRTWRPGPTSRPDYDEGQIPAFEVPKVESVHQHTGDEAVASPEPLQRQTGENVVALPVRPQHQMGEDVVALTEALRNQTGDQVVASSEPLQHQTGDDIVALPEVPQNQPEDDAVASSEPPQHQTEEDVVAAPESAQQQQPTDDIIPPLELPPHQSADNIFDSTELQQHQPEDGVVATPELPTPVLSDPLTSADTSSDLYRSQVQNTYRTPNVEVLDDDESEVISPTSDGIVTDDGSGPLRPEDSEVLSLLPLLDNLLRPVEPPVPQPPALDVQSNPPYHLALGETYRDPQIVDGEDDESETQSPAHSDRSENVGDQTQPDDPAVMGLLPYFGNWVRIPGGWDPVELFTIGDFRRQAPIKYAKVLTTLAIWFAQLALHLLAILFEGAGLGLVFYSIQFGCNIIVFALRELLTMPLIFWRRLCPMFATILNLFIAPWKAAFAGVVPLCTTSCSPLRIRLVQDFIAGSLGALLASFILYKAPIPLYPLNLPTCIIHQGWSVCKWPQEVTVDNKVTLFVRALPLLKALDTILLVGLMVFISMSILWLLQCWFPFGLSSPSGNDEDNDDDPLGDISRAENHGKGEGSHGPGKPKLTLQVHHKPNDDHDKRGDDTVGNGKDAQPEADPSLPTPATAVQIELMTNIPVDEEARARALDALFRRMQANGSITDAQALHIKRTLFAYRNTEPEVDERNGKASQDPMVAATWTSAAAHLYRQERDQAKDFSAKCKQKCQELFDEVARQKILNSAWEEKFDKFRHVIIAEKEGRVRIIDDVETEIEADDALSIASEETSQSAVSTTAMSDVTIKTDPSDCPSTPPQTTEPAPLSPSSSSDAGAEGRLVIEQPQDEPETPSPVSAKKHRRRRRPKNHAKDISSTALSSVPEESAINVIGGGESPRLSTKTTRMVASPLSPTAPPPPLPSWTYKWEDHAAW